MTSPGPLLRPTPEERARRVAEAMWAADEAPRRLGLSLDAVGPGRAELSLSVEARHLNANGTCHGGCIFTLADSAFAYASNSHNVRTAAAQNAITFVAPAHAGDRLRALAVEVLRAGRTGIYDVTVSNQDGAVVALMRGHSRALGGAHFEEETDG